MVGIEEIDTEAEIAEQLAIVQDAPAVPFGIGLVAWVIDQRPGATRHRYCRSPVPDLHLVRRPGTACCPAARRGHPGRLAGPEPRWAETALAAGVDVLVAQGTEGGGHTGSVGTLPLLQIVLELTDRPVLAAGGIATGRGLAAVLAAGASGAWVGTPFLLAEEARNSPRARDRIAKSDETQTLYTSVYDRLQDKAWPAEFRGRALRNPFNELWTGREDELGQGSAPREEFMQAKALEDYDVAHIYAGQSVGLLDTVSPAATIVSTIEKQADRLLAAAGDTVASSKRSTAEDDPRRNYREKRRALDQLWEGQDEGKPPA